MCLKANSSFDCSNHNAGLQWALHTSQRRDTSGWAKTRPPGCCPDATTRGWRVTTARRCPWSPRHTCGAWEYCWTTTPDLCLSTTLWDRSTCTRLTSPLLSRSVRCLTCGTDVSQSLPDSPSQTT